MDKLREAAQNLLNAAQWSESDAHHVLIHRKWIGALRAALDYEGTPDEEARAALRAAPGESETVRLVYGWMDQYCPLAVAPRDKEQMRRGLAQLIETVRQERADD